MGITGADAHRQLPQALLALTDLSLANQWLLQDPVLAEELQQKMLWIAERHLTDFYQIWQKNRGIASRDLGSFVFRGSS